MSRDPIRPATLLSINFLLGLTALVLGCLAAWWTGARHVAATAGGGGLASIASDLRMILGNNTRVALSTLLGLPVLGLYGNLVLIHNCFRFGFDAVALGASDPRSLLFLAGHGALELSAFVLVTASVQGLSLALVLRLVKGCETRFDTWLRLAAMSWVVLVLAAVVETWTKYVREGLPFSPSPGVWP